MESFDELETANELLYLDLPPSEGIAVAELLGAMPLGATTGLLGLSFPSVRLWFFLGEYNAKIVGQNARQAICVWPS
ncbi:MAG: hypothetical protein ISQ15_09910 [Ilumatobacteraceae bacterium]|nr:hypothetical protein [Ilumatobacteraceae bacterium]